MSTFDHQGQYDPNLTDEQLHEVNELEMLQNNYNNLLSSNLFMKKQLEKVASIIVMYTVTGRLTDEEISKIESILEPWSKYR